MLLFLWARGVVRQEKAIRKSRAGRFSPQTRPTCHPGAIVSNSDGQFAALARADGCTDRSRLLARTGEEACLRPSARDLPSVFTSHPSQGLCDAPVAR